MCAECTHKPNRTKTETAPPAPTSRAYADYLKTRHWRETRLVALRKFGGWCEECGDRPATEVHHLTYERLGKELPSDLRPLCSQCHEAEHEPAIAARTSRRQ